MFGLIVSNVLTNTKRDGVTQDKFNVCWKRNQYKAFKISWLLCRETTL